MSPSVVAQRYLLESEDFLTKVTATNILDSIGPLSMDVEDPLPDDQIIHGLDEDGDLSAKPRVVALFRTVLRYGSIER